MIVEFYDRQNELNPLNGTAVGDDQQLRQIFGGFEDRPPFFCELVGENNCSLLVGIGRSVGCVQYTRQNGRAPYLMATTVDSKRRNEHVEFFAGNTPTPVPARYCLPLDVVKEIAVHFQKTGSATTMVEWEEI